jgi:uncharacterized protein (TIGR03437 family)
MSAVLKLGPTIAQDKVRRTDTSRVGDFRGVVCFLRPQTNQGSLRVIMFKAKSLRSLLINIFASAGLFAAASGLAMAQQVALSLASGSAIPGRSVSLNLSLTTSGGAQPTALQWIIAYPASAISSVSVTPGTAATAASKNVTCSSRAGSTICVVFGAHDNALSNGVLATATLNIAAGTIVTSAPVQVASVTAITAADLSIPTSATGRVIAIRPASGTAINGSAATTSQESSASSTPGSAATLFNPATAVAGDVCSPGGLASLSGEGFTSQGAQKATSFPLPTSLGNVQVKVNGKAVPLLFASASQVNFQCPQLAPGSPLDVTLIAESGAAMPAASSAMATAVPGLFTIDATTQGVILIASTNQIAMPETQGTPSRPAKPGEYLAIYADGLGEVLDGSAAGTTATLDPQIQLRNRVRIFVGDVQIAPESTGFAPGTPGVFEIGAQLPQNVPAGSAVPLHIQVILLDGSVAESNEVSLAIGTAGEAATPTLTP